MRHTCRGCSIRSQALCSALPDATLEQINRISRRRRLAAGRALFSEDEAASMVANVLSGVAKVSVSLPDGRTQVVGLHFAGDFVGRPFAGPVSQLIEAATDIELCCFERSRFEALLREHKGLEELFVRRITDELDAARDWMLLLGHKSAEERVASLIGHCLDRLEPPRCGLAQERRGPIRIDLPLSRSEMAQYLGMTIETVSRMLKRLSSDGVIAIEPGRGLRVLDRVELERRAERIMQ
ncbi:MAG: Crp/Fnr family transcriptional regulator [Hyphomicrobiaceae bacterium]|nr:Crp/Fnr family transcriptional regulator [Hyphomicrobiaceae bacterium]